MNVSINMDHAAGNKLRTTHESVVTNTTDYIGNFIFEDGKLDGKNVDKKFVDSIISTLGLEDKVTSLPNQLSGGQQQRVAIARALASKPAILLCDEPTGNLDSRTSQDVLGLLKISSSKYEQTIVMITHNEEIAQMADRIVRIEDGRIISGN